jgi:hypothetical protein
LAALAVVRGKEMTEPLRVPDLEAQRSAMKKLSFLVGTWVGEAHVLRGPGQIVQLVQTEEARYKLDGLILVIEGVGRTSEGAAVLQAFGVISYEDERNSYRMRAFNDGRFLETDVTLLEDGGGISWGFALGEVRTKSVLRINEKGEWTEMHEINIGSQPTKKLMEVVVRRQE